MTDRERLVEQIGTFCEGELGANFNKDILDKFADHILADGWIRPPCKVGDTVWLIGNMRLYTKETICSRKIISVQRLRTGETLMHFKDGCFSSDAIGVYAFTSREEAEKALRDNVPDTNVGNKKEGGEE